jgi:uncharacterized protein YecE (DUF72 family)
MAKQQSFNLDTFHFRGLHPHVFLGTASDRYAGWIGQIYSKDRYSDRITRRTNRVGGQSFVEEVLPVDSVEEYFQHFATLELDFTFYRLLLERDGKPTSTYHVLQRYGQQVKKGDRFILKVPQVIFAQKLWRGGTFSANEAYLNAKIFRNQFFKPAVELLGPCLQGLIFEQEYQRKKDRTPAKEMAEALNTFFEEIPRDDRYHVELRTESFLIQPVFEVLEKHGVGQVLSHWTWLPSLRKQFAKSGHKFCNSGGQSIIRLMTPRGVRYEEAYSQAHPFNALVDGMLQRGMIEETTELMDVAVNQGVRINVIINNRAGGNAPLVARQIAQRFLEI